MALGSDIFINYEGLLKEMGSNVWHGPNFGPEIFINLEGLLIERQSSKRGSTIYWLEHSICLNKNNVLVFKF